MKNVVITASMLEKLRACPGQIYEFKHHFGEAAVFNSRKKLIATVKELYSRFDWAWTIENYVRKVTPIKLWNKTRARKSRIFIMYDLDAWWADTVSYLDFFPGNIARYGARYDRVYARRMRRLAILFAKAMWEAA